MLLHVYEGLPNLDWQSCENGHHQSSMDTAHTRCDWCRLTINKIASSPSREAATPTKPQAACQQDTVSARSPMALLAEIG